MLAAVCSACGKPKQRKTLCYDAQMKGYCMDICCFDHPNSPTNLKERGNFADLMPYEQASQTIADRANELYRTGAQLNNKRVRNVNAANVISDTISFRIRDEAHTQYIMYVMGREGFNRVSQAIHTIINTAILADQNFLDQAAGITHLVDVPVFEQLEEKLQADKPKPTPQAEEVFEV